MLEHDYDPPDPYGTGLPATSVISRRKGTSPLPSWRADLASVHLVVQEGTRFRAPDLADHLERRLARRLAYRVLRRLERLELLRSRPDDADPEIEREIDDLEEVLETLHAVLPIDVDGLVPRVIRALGPSWLDTDPNDPSPYVRRSSPRRRRSFANLGPRVLLTLVEDRCSRGDGTPVPPEVAAAEVLDALVGDDEPEVREELRPAVVGLVERVLR